jgi:hypothetical protein
MSRNQGLKICTVNVVGTTSITKSLNICREQSTCNLRNYLWYQSLGYQSSHKLSRVAKAVLVFQAATDLS